MSLSCLNEGVFRAFHSTGLTRLFHLLDFCEALKVQDLLAHDEPHEASPPPVVIKQRRSGLKHPVSALPASEWLTVLRRVVEQKEPLRTVAAAYGVSPETIRRILLHVRKQRGQQEA